MRGKMKVVIFFIWFGDALIRRFGCSDYFTLQQGPGKQEEGSDNKNREETVGAALSFQSEVL